MAAGVYKRGSGVEQAAIAAPIRQARRKQTGRGLVKSPPAPQSSLEKPAPAYMSASPRDREDHVQKIIALAMFCSLSVTPALARGLGTNTHGTNTWAGNTAEDMVAEQDACRGDAYRFCGGNTIFIFEMENCLKQHMRRLSKPCRQMLAPTDFRKYYRAEPGPFDF